jgi:DNA-binding NtrC family response regulator
MQARLTLESGDAQPPACDLDPDRPATLGRSRDNTIVLRDEHASRVHARIQFEDGRWRLRDLGLNGTRVNGERVRQETALAHGHEIRIGDVCFRFTTPGSVTVADPAGPITPPMPAAPEGGASSTLDLKPDELTALCAFMTGAVEEADPRELIRRALEAVLQQTAATVTGFLSLDPQDPLAKLVLPEQAKVDVPLSRQLTRRVEGEGRTVWLGTGLADSRPTDSLTPFTDAICLPVKASGPALGALHVYRSNHAFRERDVRFCEALVGYLAHGLEVLRARRTLEAENSRLRGHLPAADELVGDSPELKALRVRIAKAAVSPATVLVTGESGTGKELVAVALHRRSGRAGPFVAVNCAAIARDLLEAELFGRCKGAYTGSDRDQPGLFQQADEGTLFLDEVGELSPECQAKLLRVIETKGFRPVGATAEVRADVRIVAATHRDLEREVAGGRFRQDLFFRLKVVTIPVPPLREHAADIPYLIQFFLDKLEVECRRKVRLTDAAVRKLAAYSWPGNVRQLRAVLENAVVMADAEELDTGDFHLPADAAPGSPRTVNLEELEKWAIPEALKRTGGNKTQAAKLLGINRDTLASKMEKYGIGG